jgi:hypothetical protein
MKNRNYVRESIAILIANIPSILCIVAAVYMAIQGIKGWGWLIFVALIFGHTLGKSEEEKKNGEHYDN